ncbi:MAG: tail fiber protein [Archangium sp.]|nr:tail fiber protein [Archangium sp.]
MTWERLFVRFQVGALLVLLLTAAAWGPREAILRILGAGPPLSGELVPRQIPYRGFLERDGVPVNDPGLAMRFRVYAIDGGVLHEESRSSVPVQNGQFSVELGDGAPIPLTVFQENFLELEVAVGATPVVLTSRQRLLTVPFSAHSLESWRASSATGVLATQIVPPGTVTAFAGTTAPTGWLKCDGLAVSKTQYPDLYAAIGDAHGTPDPQSFNLPDYRGRFLRGTDDGANRDPDRTTRTSSNPGGNSGDALGSIQGDMFASHQHRNAAANSTSPAFNGNPYGAMDYAPNSAWFTGATGGAETRPVNVTVNWIIKY